MNPTFCAAISSPICAAVSPMSLDAAPIIALPTPMKNMARKEDAVMSLALLITMCSYRSISAIRGRGTALRPLCVPVAMPTGATARVRPYCLRRLRQQLQGVLIKQQHDHQQAHEQPERDDEQRGAEGGAAGDGGDQERRDDPAEWDGDLDRAQPVPVIVG